MRVTSLPSAGCGVPGPRGSRRVLRFPAKSLGLRGRPASHYHAASTRVPTPPAMHGRWCWRGRCVLFHLLQINRETALGKHPSAGACTCVTSSSVRRASGVACERVPEDGSPLPPATSSRRPGPAARLPRAWSYCSGRKYRGVGLRCGPRRGPSGVLRAPPLQRRLSAPAAAAPMKATLCLSPASPASRTGGGRQAAGAPRGGPAPRFLVRSHYQPVSFGS